MENLNEELLSAWLRLSTVIINNRVVSDLSYNESLVCNLLCKAQKQHPQNQLTATDLCIQTNMLKSHMNRTLNQLEEKGLIIRKRSSQDKRQIWIQFNMDSADLYLKQHEQILLLLDTITETIGPERTKETIRSLNQISDITDRLLNHTEKKS